MSGLCCTITGVGTDGVCYLNLTAGSRVASHWFSFGEPSSFIRDPYVWEMVWGSGHAHRSIVLLIVLCFTKLLQGCMYDLSLFNAWDAGKNTFSLMSNAVRKWVALSPEGKHTNIQAFPNIHSTLCCYQIPLQKWEHRDFRVPRDFKWMLYTTVRLLFSLYHTALSKQDSDLCFRPLIMRSKNEIFRTYFESVFFLIFKNLTHNDY